MDDLKMGDRCLVDLRQVVHHVDVLHLGDLVARYDRSFTLSHRGNFFCK
jgi:hypothetical protein